MRIKNQRNKIKRITSLLQLKKMAVDKKAADVSSLQTQIKQSQQQAEDLGGYCMQRHQQVLGDNKQPVSSLLLQEHQRFSQQIGQVLLRQQHNVQQLQQQSQLGLQQLKILQAEQQVVDNLQQRLQQQVTQDLRKQAAVQLDSDSQRHALHRPKQ